jgi:hypothetical protein
MTATWFGLDKREREPDGRVQAGDKGCVQALRKRRVDETWWSRVVVIGLVRNQDAVLL